jgi:hypothetical protein
MLALLPKKRERSKGVPKDAAKSPAGVDGERIKKYKKPRNPLRRRTWGQAVRDRGFLGQCAS